MREKVRAFLGVWAPMLLGVLLLALAVNFLLASPAPESRPYFRVDPIADAFCGGAVVLVGGILMISTYGRWRKSSAARRQYERQRNL